MENIVKNKIVVTILNKDKVDTVVKILKKNDISYSYSINGIGTASSSLLSYFGLDEIKKEIIISIVPCVLETKILHILHNDYEIFKPGNGISFSIPITSASRYLSTVYESALDTKEEYKIMNDKEYELIVVIAKEGYASVAMDAAKRVGAGGGTLIKGIGLGTEEAKKLLGITIEPEKDIVLILTEKQDKHKVMKEVTESVGLSHEGRGIMFALPVDNVVGLTDKINFSKIS